MAPIYSASKRQGSNIMAKRAGPLIIAIALGTALAQTAHASSDEAWAQLAKNIKASCLKAAGANITKPTIIVDSYGSENFGFAIVSGKSGGYQASFICVYDKKTGATELGSEMEIEVTKKAAQ